MDMKSVKITHILQDGTVIDSIKNVNISAEAISLTARKAIYEIISAAE